MDSCMTEVCCGQNGAITPCESYLTSTHFILQQFHNFVTKIVCLLFPRTFSFAMSEAYSQIGCVGYAYKAASRHPTTFSTAKALIAAVTVHAYGLSGRITVCRVAAAERRHAHSNDEHHSSCHSLPAFCLRRREYWLHCTWIGCSSPRHALCVHRRNVTSLGRTLPRSSVDPLTKTWH